MDDHSIADRSSELPAAEGDMPGISASRSTPASVSAGIAAANAHMPEPTPPGPLFSGEDGGWSLAEMAHSDLDAALQLLVERAHYITGAAGAAIALRRGQHNDMLCRASTGSNAPELGALLSMEYGLSGECVRTRQPLRCDDAERDPRVNHEICRQLGIASVVVMPVVSDEQVLGVFELLSGKPHAFEERDLIALKRLSEMVETAMKYAVAAPTVPALGEPTAAESQATVDGIVSEPPRLEPPASAIQPHLAPLSVDVPPQALENTESKEAKPEPVPVPRKPLFWSAAVQAQASASRADGVPEAIAVPPVLRNLQKCQACGFPVSQGRTFCVECEEKQWRGQRLPQPAATPSAQASQAREPARKEVAIPAAAVTPTPRQTSSATESAAMAAQPPSAFSSHVRERVPDPPTNAPGSGNSALFLGSAAAPESWFAANKYILGALLVVAIVVAAIAWLR